MSCADDLWNVWFAGEASGGEVWKDLYRGITILVFGKDYLTHSWDSGCSELQRPFSILASYKLDWQCRAIVYICSQMLCNIFQSLKWTHKCLMVKLGAWELRLPCSSALPLLMILITGTGPAIAWCASTIHCLVVDITLRHLKGWWHILLWILMSLLKHLRKSLHGPLWLFV